MDNNNQQVYLNRAIFNLNNKKIIIDFIATKNINENIVKIFEESNPSKCLEILEKRTLIKSNKITNQIKIGSKNPDNYDYDYYLGDDNEKLNYDDMRKQILGIANMFAHGIFDDQNKLEKLNKEVENKMSNFKMKRKIQRRSLPKEVGQRKIVNKKGQTVYVVDLADKNGNIKTHSIARLVAEAHVPNPNNFKFVRHKDENMLNNIATNLEWTNEEDEFTE